MKRKTNLFYTSGPDSKFITFSNYTEALTGNYLSVNTKLFPDNFLCLKIKYLNSKTKPLFIKYLAEYYENKLAVLRDNNIKINDTIEHNICPLAYLLEAILNVVTQHPVTTVEVIDGVEQTVLLGYEYLLNIAPKNYNGLNGQDYFTTDFFNEDFINNLFNDENEFYLFQNESNNNIEDTNIIDLITYIGDISEEDYYGTYTDIICNINSENFKTGIISLSKKDISSNKLSATINDYPYSLYGWENEQNANIGDYLLSNDKPIYDQSTYDENNNITSGTYYYNSNVSKLTFNKVDINHISYEKNIEFNVIIPLFSKVNINNEEKIYFENNSQTDINSNVYLTINNAINSDGINESGNVHNATFNVPLGMWIYADREYDTYIKLIKDKNLNLYPNWSLLISSQFKPFPYSTIKKENATSNNTESDSIANSFSTFAEVLSKMNEVLNNFAKLDSMIVALNKRVDNVEYDIKNIATVTNIEAMKESINDFESNMKSDMNTLKNQVYAHLNNLKWSHA